MCFPVCGSVEGMRITEKTCDTKELQKKTNKHLENMGKSIVKIKGFGSVEIVPDRVQINIHIEELFDNTTDAYKKGQENSRLIQELTEQLGVEWLSPKTKTFHINKEYEEIADQDDNRINDVF